MNQSKYIFIFGTIIPSILGGISALLLFTCKGFGIFGCTPLLYILNPWLLIFLFIPRFGGISTPFRFLSTVGSTVALNPRVPSFGIIDEIGNPAFFIAVQFLFWRGLVYLFSSKLSWSEDKIRKERRLLTILTLFIVTLLIIPVIYALSDKLFFAEKRAAQYEKSLEDYSVRIDKQRTDSINNNVPIFQSVIAGTAEEGICERILPNPDTTSSADYGYSLPIKQTCYTAMAIKNRNPALCVTKDLKHWGDADICKEFIKLVANNSLTLDFCNQVEFNQKWRCRIYLSVYLQDKTICEQETPCAKEFIPYIFS